MGGSKTTQRDENAQPLINIWVIFSSLEQFVHYIFTLVIYAPGYSVDYIHKNSESTVSNISVIIQLLSSAI